MAGTSGCIPDYHVNLFGQLCKSARPSAVTTPQSEPQVDINSQVDDTSAPPPTTVPISEPDPITEAFHKHQHLIRGFSGGNVETYLAMVKDVFAEVRRDRENGWVEQHQEHQLAEDNQVDPYNKRQADYQNGYGMEHQDRTQVEYPHQQEDQHQRQHPAQHEEQPESQYHLQPQHRSQSLLEQPALLSSSLTISEDNNEASIPRQSRLQRDEDAMYYIEDEEKDGEMGCNELLWLDALLMANCTGDPKRKYGFDEVRFDD